VVVLLNGSKVWESTWLTLKEGDFTCSIQQKLQLNIYDFPDSLEIQIFGQSYFLTSMIASTKLRVPGEGKKELSGNEILNYEGIFTSEMTAAPKDSIEFLDP